MANKYSPAAYNFALCVVRAVARSHDERDPHGPWTEAEREVARAFNVVSAEASKRTGLPLTVATFA